jgi:hypothetical protein
LRRQPENRLLDFFEQLLPVLFRPIVLIVRQVFQAGDFR